MQIVCKACRLDGTVRKKCDGCGRCKTHEPCRCWTCATCQAKSGNVKERCMKCRSCAACHVEPATMRDFPFRKCMIRHKTCPQRTDHASTPMCRTCGQCKACTGRYEHCICRPHLINPLRRALGVEIEGSHWGKMPQLLMSNSHIAWHFEHDGSVTSGQELVTGVIRGDDFVYGMTDLCKKLTENGCKADTSCGVHAHVDALDLTPADLRRVYVGFWVLQSQIYGTLVRADRAKNRYCPTLPQSAREIEALMALDSDSIMEWFNKTLYGVSRQIMVIEAGYTPAEYKAKLDALKAHKYENQARRWGLNIHSWMMRGTVEFRCKEGTMDASDLMMWPLWCGWFVHRIAAMTDGQMKAWIKSPPSLREVSEAWTVRASGRAAMPDSVMAWVRSKCGSAAYA